MLTNIFLALAHYCDLRKAATYNCDGDEPCPLFCICKGYGLEGPYEDGDQTCVLLGSDIQIGVAGFGATPEEAGADFVRNLCQRQEQQEIECRERPRRQTSTRRRR